ALAEAAKRPGGAERAQGIEAVVGALERKKDPIAATGALVDALTILGGHDDAALHEALRRLAGRTFPRRKAWKAWDDVHKDTPQREWFLETIKALENENERAAATAERFFNRLVTAYAKDDAALFRELREGLGKDSIPAVRLAAIRALGTLKGSTSALEL